MRDTWHLLKTTDFPAVSRRPLEVLQVNLGYLCNQSCLHCHVNAGPTRKELMDGKMTVYLKGLQELLQRGGGEYFADQQLTIADIRSFVQVNSLAAGVLDHIPAEFVSSVAPGLVQHQKRVAADKRIVAYYGSRQ